MATLDLAKAVHTHDDRYYTESEVQLYLNTKQDNINKGLNNINIDSTPGNWVTSIKNKSNTGTFPTVTGPYWVQVVQYDTGTFISQILFTIQTSSSSTDGYGTIQNTRFLFYRYKCDLDSNFTQWNKICTTENSLDSICSDSSFSSSDFASNMEFIRMHSFSDILNDVSSSTYPNLYNSIINKLSSEGISYNNYPLLLNIKRYYGWGPIIVEIHINSLGGFPYSIYRCIYSAKEASAFKLISSF